MPDRIEGTQYVSGEGSDLMSGIEDLHPLLGKQEQQVQGKITWSESKLMIGNQAFEEEEGLNVSVSRRCLCLDGSVSPDVSGRCL